MTQSESTITYNERPTAMYIVWGIISLITGALGARKGYNFFLWMLAAGVIGLVILSFLPFANKRDQ